MRRTDRKRWADIELGLDALVDGQYDIQSVGVNIEVYSV